MSDRSLLPFETDRQRTRTRRREASVPERVAPAAARRVDLTPEPAPRKPFWSRARRWVRRRIQRPIARVLVALAVRVLPRIYLAYMRFVWRTSRVEDRGVSLACAVRDAHDGVVCVLWHDEVFSVAWAYREHRPHTLASTGDAGEVITRMLHLCGYRVFRGGSGDKARRRGEVLAEMIAHMKANRRVLYGITVDGSNGPAYKLKRGAVVIATECRRPIVCVRTWARRNIRLPTWDRMAIPLPWNVIYQYARGPFWPPEGAAREPALFEAFRSEIEERLLDLRDESLRDLGLPPEPRPGPSTNQL